MQQQPVRPPITVKPLPARTTASLPDKIKSSLDTLLANRNKPVARPTMGVLPSEMVNKSKLKMDIFHEEASEDEEDHFANVVKPG